jgi:HK97 gp10 family phage protein
MPWRAAMKLEGFAELDKALGRLPKATAKNVLKRTLMQAGRPILEAMESHAPKDTGYLSLSLGISHTLNASQRRSARSETPTFAAVHIGTRRGSFAAFHEFGTFEMQPNPFMRPAWEANKERALNIIKVELKGEIEKAAKRYAKKLAKGA